jgi:hypothetical protein
MSARLLFAAMLALCLHAQPLLAADQTEHLKDPPKVLPSTVDISGPDVNYEQVRTFMTMAFPGATVDSPDFYCVVHILNWGANDQDPSKVVGSRWYVYRGRGNATTPGGTWTTERFRGTRIYGADRVRLAYVHLNVPAEPETAVERSRLDKIGKDNSLVSSNKRMLGRVGSFVVEKDFLGVSYQIDVVKKLPAPIQSLYDALGMLQAEQLLDGLKLTQKIALYAAGTYDIAHVPSDITIAGTLTYGTALEKKTTDLGKQTYDNEGLYRWDISLGIPLRSVKELNFETSGGDVFVKEVERTKLMMFLNIYVRPVDTKNVRFIAFPRPVVGLALSKKPLERIFVGGSIGLNKVQVFAGRQWSQVETAPEPASAATSDQTKAVKYEDNWMFGINVPVRQVVDFLKAKK